MLCDARHMFEVEQVDYDKEQIDWSYITFNDNKVTVVYSGSLRNPRLLVAMRGTA